MSSQPNDTNGSVGIKAVIIIILLSIFTIFILQNTEVVEIEFLIWKLSMSRVILLLGSLFIGVIIGLIIRWETTVKKLQ